MRLWIFIDIFENVNQFKDSIQNIATQVEKTQLLWVSFRSDITAICHCFLDWKFNGPRCAECNFSCYPKDSLIWFLNIILLLDFSAKLSERFAIRELHFERKLFEYWNLLSGYKIKRCLLQSKTFLVSIFNINVKPRAFHKRLHLLWIWILKVKCKYLKFQSILE